MDYYNYRRSGNFRVKNISCKIFVALNFRGPDQPRNYFNGLPVPCVKNGYVRASLLRSRLSRLPAHLVRVSTHPTPLLRAILLVRPALLVTGRRFRHFAIRHRYSPRRNGMRERSLGVRKPISLLEVPKKSHTHC